ncbi:hypothetical protein SK803_28790 [Lentzea sp. BCCO 10_0856]|uniref:Uncharacterized protein n=1 Tax=Lentzea miocenica TaxID=3095431 RepID=A0ABU4T7T5_9PSEU|nr:hypothetical protein [Lentzea sp. BCCO 10_0856]MDX8034232.1 hypothetical protein [Lentzea sp. BCCO 10_0856]
MPMPDALAELYLRSGVGSFGGFLHFEAPDGMCTHRELIEDLLDEDLLADSTRQFLDSLPTNYFGFGVLSSTYKRHDWL